MTGPTRVTYEKRWTNYNGVMGELRTVSKLDIGLLSLTKGLKISKILEIRLLNLPFTDKELYFLFLLSHPSNKEEGGSRLTLTTLLLKYLKILILHSLYLYVNIKLQNELSNE